MHFIGDLDKRDDYLLYALPSTHIRTYTHTHIHT